MKKTVLFIWLIIITYLNTFAHSNWEAHAKDIMDVFGFIYDGRTAPHNLPIKKWIEFISSEMIDKTDFHKKLSERHRNFPNLGNGQKHRILFHWAYTAEPWNREFEKIVIEYCEINDLNIESNLRIFKSELKSEQQRRNREINFRTANLFGLADGGVERSYTRFFASMAYNVHILGDYMSDNTILLGLNDFNDLIGKIIIELRAFDPKESKILIKEINSILHQRLNIQKKADLIMNILKTNGPVLLKNGQNGYLYNRLSKIKGFHFKESESVFNKMFHLLF